MYLFSSAMRQMPHKRHRPRSPSQLPFFQTLLLKCWSPGDCGNRVALIWEGPEALSYWNKQDPLVAQLSPKPFSRPWSASLTVSEPGPWSPGLAPKHNTVSRTEFAMVPMWSVPSKLLLEFASHSNGSEGIGL